ncbi:MULTISPECIES: hypothetical protein, partial [unclassified Thiothrix]|uniref:hypothetical protein n=1 Tax=unclassified Thiothrix TaxID=2636184 RepID=UPI0032E50A10
SGLMRLPYPPEGMYLTSGSRPNVPMRVTLFTDADMVFLLEMDAEKRQEKHTPKGSCSPDRAGKK